ncbi:ABC transporter permease [Microbacterium sp.]|uniref:ABC transporter permease n=1 Tax=Microbacterium sp. TaxID=51671 RepID=UPI003C795DA4
MSLPRSVAIARTNLLLQLRDPAVHLLMVAIPLVLIPFMLPGAQAQLRAQGYAHATGAEQVVPGFAVLFAFLSTQQVITLFFREYAWGTWDRLRASAASTADIVVGKVGVAYLIQAVQLAAVVGLGALLYDYRPTGSVWALALVLATFSAVLACFGVMIVALVSSMNLAMSIVNLVGMLMAGLGGALAPVSGFPDWARAAAHVSPAYWALDAVQRISLETAGVAEVLPAIGVLVVFAIGFATVAAVRFRADSEKTGDS